MRSAGRGVVWGVHRRHRRCAASRRFRGGGWRGQCRGVQEVNGWQAQGRGSVGACLGCKGWVTTRCWVSDLHARPCLPPCRTAGTLRSPLWRPTQPAGEPYQGGPREGFRQARNEGPCCTAGLQSVLDVKPRCALGACWHHQTAAQPLAPATWRLPAAPLPTPTRVPHAAPSHPWPAICTATASRCPPPPPRTCALQPPPSRRRTMHATPPCPCRPCRPNLSGSSQPTSPPPASAKASWPTLPCRSEAVGEGGRGAGPGRLCMHRRVTCLPAPLRMHPAPHPLPPFAPCRAPALPLTTTGTGGKGQRGVAVAALVLPTSVVQPSLLDCPFPHSKCYGTGVTPEQLLLGEIPAPPELTVGALHQGGQGAGAGRRAHGPCKAAMRRGRALVPPAATRLAVACRPLCAAHAPPCPPPAWPPSPAANDGQAARP